MSDCSVIPFPPILNLFENFDLVFLGNCLEVVNTIFDFLISGVVTLLLSDTTCLIEDNMVLNKYLEFMMPCQVLHVIPSTFRSHLSKYGIRYLSAFSDQNMSILCCKESELLVICLYYSLFFCLYVFLDRKSLIEAILNF